MKDMSLAKLPENETSNSFSAPSLSLNIPLIELSTKVAQMAEYFSRTTPATFRRITLLERSHNSLSYSDDSY